MQERGWEGRWVPHLAQTSQDGSKGSPGPFISRYRPWTVIHGVCCGEPETRLLASMSKLWGPPLCLLVLLLQFLSPYVAPEQGECPLWSRSAVWRVGVPSAGERFSLTALSLHPPPPNFSSLREPGQPQPSFPLQELVRTKKQVCRAHPHHLPSHPLCPQDLQVSQGHSISWQSGPEAPDSNCLGITIHF